MQQVITCTESGLGAPIDPGGPWHLSSLVQWVLRHWLWVLLLQWHAVHKSITSIAVNAEDAVFGRILNNLQHVLQAYLDERPQLCYNPRKRTGNNKTLIEKTVDLNDRDFLIRNLYKYSYWLVFLSSIAIVYFYSFLLFFMFFTFLFLTNSCY